MNEGRAETMIIEYRAIGMVRSPFTSTSGMPIQPSRAEGTEGTVEVFPEYQQGLEDLDGFSHIILVCHLHQVKGFELKVVPFLDTTERGLFSTRAPARPNPVGLSRVRLKRIEGCTIFFEGVDLLDETPVLDIKPCVDEFDDSSNVRCGWLDQAVKKKAVSDDRFSNPKDHSE